VKKRDDLDADVNVFRDKRALTFTLLFQEQITMRRRAVSIRIIVVILTTVYESAVCVSVDLVSGLN
jgi:hypothetical protein